MARGGIELLHLFLDRRLKSPLSSKQGCQIFLGATYQNGENIPNYCKIDQHIPLQVPTKFAQIGIFGLKIYHLATLLLKC
jgi:hypothetical protein